MHRGVTIVLCGAALFAGACGGSSDTAAKNSSTTGGDVTTTTAKASAGASFGDVCAARNSTAAPQPSAAAALDYTKVEAGLRLAADKAPVEIKADFQIIATPLINYFELLKSANGDFTKLAQNPQFPAMTSAMSKPEYQAASKRIADWFQQHCGG